MFYPADVVKRCDDMRSLGLGYQEIADKAGIPLSSAWHITHPVTHGTMEAAKQHHWRGERLANGNLSCAICRERTPHGKAAGYSNWHCRCVECKKAQSIISKEHYAARTPYARYSMLGPPRLTIKQQFWIAQHGLCAMCGSPVPWDKAQLDHDHKHCDKTYGCKICNRAVLCGSCNTFLGMVLERKGGELKLTQGRAYLNAHSLS